jgi:hypothetical protein
VKTGKRKKEMNNLIFHEGIRKLKEHFGGRELNEDQIKNYRDGLKYIPNEAFQKIIKIWILAKKPIPSNFPSIQELRDEFPRWLDNNPTKKIQKPETNCIYCEGDGFLDCSRDYREGEVNYGDDRKYKTWFRCGHCEAGEAQFLGTGIARRLVHSLHTEGYTVHYSESDGGYISLCDIKDYVPDIGRPQADIDYGARAEMLERQKEELLG